MSSNLIFGTKIGQVDLGGRWVCKTHGAGSLPALASTNKHECSSAVEHWSPKPGVGISEFSTRAKSPNSSTNRTGSYGLPDRGLIPLSDSNIQYMVSIAQRKSAPLWRERLGFRNSLGTQNTEVVRMDEDTALKAAGCKRLGGSIPFASAKDKNPG